MPERKPPGVRFETWIERQIRRAGERGEFDQLPGAGRPLPDLDRPHDEMWWVKQKLRREGVSYLPPSLALRRPAVMLRRVDVEPVLDDWRRRHGRRPRGSGTPER